MKKNLLSLAFAASLVMTASAQVPTMDFETWSSYMSTPTQPQGWESANILVLVSGSNPTSVTQATSPNNYQGTYAAKIQTVVLNTNPSSATIPDTIGFMFTGTFLLSAPYVHYGYPYTARPASFSYYTKYQPVGSDNGYCTVFLSKWNGSSRDTIAYGADLLNTAISIYQQRNVNLTYVSTNFPDSCTIIFSASAPVHPKVGSVLYVDAASFNGWTGIAQATDNNGVSIYPNPSSSLTNFDVTSENANNVVVYDMTGREVTSSIILNKKATINSSNLAEGVYSYSIVDKQGEVISRGKFSVAQ